MKKTMPQPTDGELAILRILAVRFGSFRMIFDNLAADELSWSINERTSAIIVGGDAITSRDSNLSNTFFRIFTETSPSDYSYILSAVQNLSLYLKRRYSILNTFLGICLSYY